MSKKLIYNSYDEIFFSRTKELALKRVQSTYDRGIDINAINERTGFTALMLATVFDHRSRGTIMEFLIKHGADLNAVGSSKVDRCTALHVAAQKGHYDAIEMLIKHGADPTKLDDKCCSPSQVSTFAYEQESDPGRQLLHLRCSEKLRSKENETKSKRENNFLTPKKKEEIINQVLRRARTASTPNNDHRPTSPLRRNRFLSASISPSGRPPISPRSPFSTGGSPFNNRALPVSSKSSVTPQNTPRKMNSKKIANLDDSFILEDRLKPISSPPRNSSDLSYTSSESRQKHSSLVKSPTKENSTQTPREIETQTDPDVSDPIQVKTRIIKVPISPKPREIQRENATCDLNKIQKSIDELTIQVDQQAIPLSNPPEHEAKSSPVDSTPPNTEIISNIFPDIKVINAPIENKIVDNDDEKENIWNYFDKSIRVPNLDKTYALGPDDHILPDTEIIDPDETLKPTQKKIEKRILNEVNESVYHGNETFIIGECDSSKLQNESKSNLSNEKLNMTKMSSDSSAENQNSQQSIDTSACLFESIKPKEYSINTILEETENHESDLENQTKKQEQEISPRDITPFPSSIINLASLQPPAFTSYKSEITQQPLNEKLKNKSTDYNTTPVDDNNLINQINLESGQNEEGHLSEESEDENESAESFKLEFSFDPSQESSFSSRINETIEPSCEQLSSSRTSLLSESINLEEIDKMDHVELRKNLSKYQIKMPNLHNQKLIGKYRNELKDLTKKSRFGAIYSSELLKGFEVFPKRNDYQKVQERLLDTNNISSKTRSASKKYYNYVLLDPRTLNNLQLRSQKLKDDGKEMSQMEIIQCFVKSVFYVGKGCGARSGQHIKEAFKHGKQQSAKLDRINEILNTDQPSAGRKYGLVIQQFGHDYTNKQSLLQEAAIIKAIGITNLTNVKNERFGENWSDTEICRLGCIGLFNACSSYLLQPENFIYPENI